MTETQTAWVAGVIEGEGCISVGWFKHWHRVQVLVNMTDYDVIERLQKWSGLGSICINRLIKDRKPSWTWSVSKQTEVLELLTTIFPFLCSRRQAKALEGLEVLKEKVENGGLGRGRYHRAKTTCRNGHLLNEENVWIGKSGKRICRACSREGVKRWKLKDPEHARQIHREALKRFRERQKGKHNA